MQPTYAKNITNGTNVYIPADSNNQHIHKPLAEHLARCKLVSVVITYQDDAGRMFRVTQLNEG